MRGDKYKGKVRYIFFHFNCQFRICKVWFGDRKNPCFVEQLRIELLQLIQKDLIFFSDIPAINRDHKQQQGIPLNVAEET